MPASLDPENWDAFRAEAHELLDDLLNWLRHARDRPVWRPMPAAIRARFSEDPPAQGTQLRELTQDFQNTILPFGNGNDHPRFFGWVHGAGNAAGVLGEIAAAVFNANCGGRDHAGIEVERQVIRWAASLLGLPAESSGLLLTGSSLANFVAVLAARHRALPDARRDGIGGAALTAYASSAAHGCIARAMDMAGFGTTALRPVDTDSDGRIRLDRLASALTADRAAGFTPFLIVGTAGTVDFGAFDPLSALADVAAHAGCAFHVDAAFGATVATSARTRPLLAGIERADSVAFDFHKWFQVPYDAGCVLIRDPALHRATFAQSLAYLQGHARGLAGGGPWPRDLGPDLSRSFRALKVWWTIRHYGTEAFGEVVERSCAVARHLAARIEREDLLELLAPVPLNIVCFRVRDGAADLDAFNADIVASLQERGVAAPSTTTIGGRLAIRAAVFNHRTVEADADGLIDAVLALAREKLRECDA